MNGRANMKIQISKFKFENWNSRFKILLGFFVLVFTFCFVRYTEAATLYAGSAYQTVEEGQTFVVDWFLDTENESINTVSFKLNFSKDALEVSDAAAGQSLLSLWIKTPIFDNSKGTVEMIGGAPNGLQGTAVPVLRTIFRAKASGSGEIAMDETSAVLRNDGQGSQTELNSRVLAFLIVPSGFLPVSISSPSHPDPNAWYSEQNVVIHFTPLETENYSYSFSSNLDIFPDDLADPVDADLRYENLPDGIYYFKLNSKISNENWQEVGIFRVQIDATPPEDFDLLLTDDPNINDGRPFISFAAVDKTSGISHYEIK